MTTVVLRSVLFVPGDRAERMPKALAAGADGVILDLEDAVAVAEKSRARTQIAQFLRTVREHPHVRRFVRINARSTGLASDDIAAIVVPGLDGIVVPKAETRADIELAEREVSARERALDITPGSIELMPIVETAKGLENVAEVFGASTRLRRASFGAGDFSLDLGVAWDDDNPLILAARSRVALASRAAGIDPPLDTVFPYLEAPERFERECRLALANGYQGKMCIHPKQVATVNAVFTPAEADVARARAIVDAFARAERAGNASITVEGVFVDYPIAARAQRIVALAELVAAQR